MRACSVVVNLLLILGNVLNLTDLKFLILDIKKPARLYLEHYALTEKSKHWRVNCRCAGKAHAGYRAGTKHYRKY